MDDLIQKLKELRRQAGYEPNAWYEQKEEELIHKVKDEAKREASVEILSKASDKLVDYKPKPNFSFKAIQWDDLFDICSLKEDGGE